MKELINIKEREKIDQIKWDIWIHRIFDKSFHDFSLQLERPGMDNEIEMSRVVSYSARILSEFIPED